MFSGIIEKVAKVTARRDEGMSLILDLATGYSDLALGESVAVNGVCLTVTHFTPDGSARFFVSPETIDRSNLGALKVGSAVNLERSVSLETRLSGHMVQGHVDGKAVLTSLSESSDAHLLEMRLPDALARYCVEKGSISLNGISLTLNAVDHDAEAGHTIALTIIPHTWEHTNLHASRVGDEINVEVDVVAKYVERLCQPYLTH